MKIQKRNEEDQRKMKNNKIEINIENGESYIYITLSNNKINYSKPLHKNIIIDYDKNDKIVGVEII